jgi:pimeloyl-ACP methyl ester carboxylesterase
MTTASINGNTIYYEVHGTGDPVLFLHGGFSSIELMRPQMNALAATFAVHAPERPGHGRSPDVPRPLSYGQSLADTVAYLDAVHLDRVHVVGFSDGAIIGLLLALHHPDRIQSLVAISGNLDPSGFVVDDAAASESEGEPTAADPTEAESTDVEPEVDTSRQIYNELSPDGPEHADVMLDKLMTLWTTEPNIAASELGAITVPTLIMAGDRDVISLDHSRLMAFSIPRGELCIVPRAGHGLLEQRPQFVTFAIQEFLDSVI